jgi:type IV pilus assembly protein PilM
MSYLDKFYRITESIIGLDIGYDTLKIVQLNRQARPAKLMAYNASSIPPGAMTAKDKDHTQEIANIILKTMHEANFRRIRGKYVVSGLPESRVFTKIIDIPIMNEKEMEQAVPHEASRHIPLPLSDIYLDYQPLNLKTNQNESVLVVAAPKILVERYLKILKLSSLQLLALETKPIAAGRALL